MAPPSEMFLALTARNYATEASAHTAITFIGAVVVMSTLSYASFTITWAAIILFEALCVFIAAALAVNAWHDYRIRRKYP